MKPFIHLIAFILFAQVASAQQFVLKGTVYAASDSAAVPYATIYNQTRGEGFITNINGGFSFKVYPADTIRISAVGFERFVFVAAEKEERQTIYLGISTQLIDPIIVRAFPSKQLFKQEFMALDLPEENHINLNIPDNVGSLMLPEDAGEIPVLASNDIRAPGIAFSDMRSGAITKLKKEEIEIDQHKKMQEAIDRKYSNEFIGKLTGLQDEEKIAELKKFCKFTNDFILHSSEYDVALAIKDCFKEFEKGRN